MGSTTLTSFADLPNELPSRIIDLACRNPTSGEAAATSSSLFDVPTLLNLILVSRHLYPILVEKLYRRVRITTISALRSLASALVSRPALGRCIKSLHLGPEDNLPEDWTPIVYEAGGEGEKSEGVICLATSLGHQPGDADRLPRWCLPRQHWPAEGSAPSEKTGAASSCRHQAIAEAIQSAVTTLNVAPGRPHEDASGERSGRDAWAVRLWMAQAALDLYLAHLRKLEDQTSSSQALHAAQPDGKRYPRLALALPSTAMASTPTGAATSLHDSPETLTLAEPQLLTHLERRGSPTDRLDHPLILARCGVLGFNIEAENEPDDVYLRGDGPYSLDQRLDRNPDRKAPSGDCVDLFSMREGQKLMQKVVYPARKSTVSALDPAISRGATIGSLLGLARSILCFTPSLANLSLTGIFERIICRSRSPPGLKALRFLSIGPSPPCWHLQLDLNVRVLEKLKGLRLCGVELWEAQTKSIAGHEGALPCLRELRYTMADGTSVGRLARVLTERFGPPNREEEQQLTDKGSEVAHSSEGTSDGSQSSTSSNATSSPPPKSSSGPTSSSESSDNSDSSESSDSSNDSTSSPRPLSPQPSRRLLIDIRLSPHQMGHIKANRPSALYDAYVNEEILAYGPRHRLVIEEDPELEVEEEKDGPLFPKKLPVGMWGGGEGVVGGVCGGV